MLIGNAEDRGYLARLSGVHLAYIGVLPEVGVQVYANDFINNNRNWMKVDRTMPRSFYLPFIWKRMRVEIS